MDEREARIRNLLAWARTYHTSVNGIDQAAYDVEQVLAALAAADAENKRLRVYVRAIHSCACENRIDLISAMTERLVREFNAAAAGLPASGEGER